MLRKENVETEIMTVPGLPTARGGGGGVAFGVQAGNTEHSGRKTRLQVNRVNDVTVCILFS